MTLSGTAADDVGVTSVTWLNQATGASGTAVGTTSWSVDGIQLVVGSNVIVVTAHDAAGNTGSATITVTYDPGSPPSSTFSLRGPMMLRYR